MLPGQIVQPIRRSLTMLRSRSSAACLLLLCLVALETSVPCVAKEDAADLLLRGFRRRLTDEDEGAVALTDRTFAFLTKYEETGNSSVITSSPRAYALYGWYDKGKAIKYAIVAPPAAADALTATTGADIKGIHVHVSAMRGQNSAVIFGLAKASGPFEMKEGYKVYAQGTLMDSNVSASNNSMYKTAADLWKAIEGGMTYTNIHTNLYPDGEARGQNDWSYEDIEVVEDLLSEDLRKNDDNWRMAFLTPYEQTGSVAGNSTARAIAVYGWDGSKIQYHVLSASKPTDSLAMVKGYKDIAGIHIHVGATRGKNAATLVPLTVPTDGDWKTVKGLRVYAEGAIGDADISSYTSNSNNSKVPITSVKSLWDMIVAGNTYTNVHTPMNPAGEIRGQNDWNYGGLDAAKLSIPGDAGKSGKENFALSLKPCVSVIVGALMCLMVLA